MCWVYLGMALLQFLYKNKAVLQDIPFLMVIAEGIDSMIKSMVGGGVRINSLEGKNIYLIPLAFLT